jgi:signal transduction histidine kinase
VRTRAIAIVVAVTVVAVAALFTVAAYAVRTRDQQAELLELRRQAAQVEGLAEPDPVRWYAGARASISPEHALTIYDRRGRRVRGPQRSSPRTVAAARRGRSSSQHYRGSFVATEPAYADGNILGVVQVSEPTSVVQGRTRDSLLRLGGLAAGIVLVAVLVSLLAMRSLNRRLARLESYAVRVGDGDFASKFAPTGYPELDRVGVALEATARRLGGLVERERAFAGDASHQLRTPIASMRVDIEAELQAPREDPTTVLTECLDQLDRLEANVTTLLTVAAGRPPTTEPLRLDRLFADAAHRWQREYRTAGRRLTVPSGDECSVRVDAAHNALDVVLDVLLENALRHGTGAVTVDVVARPRSVCIRVADEGTAPADPDAIFRRGHTGHSDGRGIGLAMARTLAASQGAELRLGTEAHTTFEIVFVARSEELAATGA